MSLFSSTARRILTIFCGVALSAGPLLAQTDTPPPPPGQNQGPPPRYGGGGPGGPERRMEMLQRDLNLSPSQATQVKALLETERTKMDALRGNTAMSSEDRRSQMMAIHQDSDAKMRALLTPDQVTKYDAMQAQMRARMQQRNGNGGGPPGPPEPPPPPPPPPAPPAPPANPQ